DEKVVDVARSVIRDFPDDKLQRALEELEEGGHLVSDITRHNLAEALNAFSLGGKRSVVEMLRKFWPSIDHTGSQSVFGGNLADDIERHSTAHRKRPDARSTGREGRAFRKPFIPRRSRRQGGEALEARRACQGPRSSHDRVDAPREFRTRVRSCPLCSSEGVCGRESARLVKPAHVSRAFGCLERTRDQRE